MEKWHRSLRSWHSLGNGAGGRRLCADFIFAKCHRKARSCSTPTQRVRKSRNTTARCASPSNLGHSNRRQERRVFADSGARALASRRQVQVCPPSKTAGRQEGSSTNEADRRKTLLERPGTEAQQTSQSKCIELLGPRPRGAVGRPDEMATQTLGRKI